ncbi:MAG: GAF and ANTAR domain-containing protein, partial [Aquihabitans sp.]
DSISAAIEDLQFSLGEGPCVDAYEHDRPVIEPNLVDPSVSRWPAFTARAVEAGAQAVFSFPLQLGVVRLGALDLYRTTPGPLTDDQYADALAMADIATRAVLVLQAEAPPGQLASTLEAGADLRLLVHQATGMVAAQLGITVGQALVCLRANAFGTDQPLERVAADVIARTLRFDGPRGAVTTIT